MSNKLAGKVAVITGAAHGQGRSHAVKLAQEGADIIAVDICEQIVTVSYPLGTWDDLEQTAKEFEALGRRIVIARADTRDEAALDAAYAEGRSTLGDVDIVIANAGIAPMSRTPAEHEWRDVIDVNLTGTYNTVKLCVPDMVAAGRGGSIVLISSTAGLNGIGGNSPGGLGYTATAKGAVAPLATMCSASLSCRIEL